MQEENSLKLAGTLIVISVLSALVLTFVYQISDPIIQKNKATKLKEAINEVLPATAWFEEISPLPSGVSGERAGIKRVFKSYDKSDEVAGIIILSDALGFNDFIQILFGLDMGGKITRVKVLEHLETPGLGERITSDDFLRQFSGKESFEDIDTITGATISSRAVLNRVKDDSELLFELMKEGKL